MHLLVMLLEYEWPVVHTRQALRLLAIKLELGGKDLQSQGIARSPTAKKKLNRKSITVAT